MASKKPPLEVHALNPKPAQTRVTLTSNVYHQRPDDQPTGIPLSFSRACKITEDCYITRRFKLNGEWQSIDLGFVQESDIGLVVIEHVATILQIRPTAEEQAELDALLVLVGYGKDDESWMLYPGMFIPGYPSKRPMIKGDPKCKVKFHVMCK